MARFNQFAGKSPDQCKRDSETQAARKKSLETLGMNITEIMVSMGIGEKRACAEAERRLGVIWVVGRSFGHHKPGTHE